MAKPNKKLMQALQAAAEAKSARYANNSLKAQIARMSKVANVVEQADGTMLVTLFVSVNYCVLSARDCNLVMIDIKRLGGEVVGVARRNSKNSYEFAVKA